MHLMTFDPTCDLIWGFPFGQLGKISSGLFAYIYKPNGTLCPKRAHTSKKSLKTPVSYVLHFRSNPLMNLLVFATVHSLINYTHLIDIFSFARAIRFELRTHSPEFTLVL